MEDEQVGIEEELTVPAAPWHNSDTVAASFMFAANIAAAAAHHFQSLGYLAMGQAAHEWVENEKADFIEDTIGSIYGLKETGGDDND